MMYNRKALMILSHSMYRTSRYNQSEGLKNNIRDKYCLCMKVQVA